MKQNGSKSLTRSGLFSGLEAKSQSQVGTALQVYFNLGVLQEKLHQLVSDQVKSVATSLKDCLDPKKIEVAVIEQLPAAAIQQVSSLTPFIYCRLFIKIIDLPGGQIYDPSLVTPFSFLFLQAIPTSPSRILEGLFAVTR